ncbi:endolytic transglycosylase MltG [Patescibacteria group bacterium]|nr:endolytic transglycosylase MltG [Patescibacteria group bacterium]
MTKEGLLQSLINGGFLKTPRIIEAFKAIDRADFVLPEYRNNAYENKPLPIGFGQTISQPLTVAFMLELLEPKEGERILDIGAGSGWQSALLGCIVGENGSVIGIERVPELCAFAQKNIETYGFFGTGRIKLLCQDAVTEIPEGHYDKIIAAAAASREIPETWRRQTKIGGKIIAPVGNAIWLFEKKSETEWDEREFQGFAFVPLVEKVAETKVTPKRGIAAITKKIAEPYQTSESTKIQKTAAKNKLYPYKKVFMPLGIFVLTVAAVFSYEAYLPHTNFQNQKNIIIQKGMGSRALAEALKEQGFINSKWAFVAYVTALRKSSDLKPGSYTFFQNATMASITRDLIAGKPAERIVTIPEGWSVREISRFVESQGMFSADDFQKFVGIPAVNYGYNKKYPKPKDFSWRFTFLADKPDTVGLEGYLFPDTYRIYNDASMEDMVLAQLANFDEKLAHEMRQDIVRQGKTIFQVITMASLIEKEVSDGHDRKVVSGILWKRLQAGIPLQVDATVSYVTGKKGAISNNDIQTDSPYNTYKYRGLPLGPIANPGLSAILAAIYPEKSPYWYYLSTKKGQTIFSKTLEEHNRAKAKYLNQ